MNSTRTYLHIITRGYSYSTATEGRKAWGVNYVRLKNGIGSIIQMKKQKQTNHWCSY